MPDWIIHMGAGRLMGRPATSLDARWLCLGAVLPDAIPRCLSALLGAFPTLEPTSAARLQLYLSYLHTPVSVALLGAALVVLARVRGPAAVGLASGAASHFVLDLMQRTFGGGTSVFYPFDVTGMSWQVAWYENPATPWLVLVSGIYLLAVLRRRPTDRVLRAPSRREWGLVAALLAVCFAMPAFAVESGIEQNVWASRIAVQPDSYEGALVDLPVASIREADEVRLEIDVLGERFSIDRQWLPGVGVGDHVSVRGIHRSGLVEPREVFVHDYTFKRLVSVLGLLLLGWLWSPELLRRREVHD